MLKKTNQVQLFLIIHIYLHTYSYTFFSVSHILHTWLDDR